MEKGALGGDENRKGEREVSCALTGAGAYLRRVEALAASSAACRLRGSPVGRSTVAPLIQGEPGGILRALIQFHTPPGCVLRAPTWIGVEIKVLVEVGLFFFFSF